MLFYFSAFAVFLYRRTESMTILRSTRDRGAVRRGHQHQGAHADAGGAAAVDRLLLGTGRNPQERAALRDAGSRGSRGRLSSSGACCKALLPPDSTFPALTPATYFFTQCRVIWTYVRLFFLPFGQNVDPDVAVSHSLLDHGAIFGLAGPGGPGRGGVDLSQALAAGGIRSIHVLLLLAPTSSFVPISDVSAERRMYLPFLGLVLVCLEFLRRLKIRRRPGSGVGYPRRSVPCSRISAARCGPVRSALWQDAATKSPQKWRPHFQLASAFYESGNCPRGRAELSRRLRTWNRPPSICWWIGDWRWTAPASGRMLW